MCGLKFISFRSKSILYNVYLILVLRYLVKEFLKHFNKDLDFDNNLNISILILILVSISLVMTLWKKVQALTLNLKHVICKKYAEVEIPIQIRHHAAEWIEENWRPSIQKPDEEKVGEIVSQLTEEIRMKGRELGLNWESFAGCRLQTMAADLEKQNPMEVYTKIEECILEEMIILRENKNQISDKNLPNYIGNKRKIEKSPQEILISELTEKLCENRWSWIYIIEILFPLKNEEEISAVAMETLEQLQDLVSQFFCEILTLFKWGGAKEFICEKVEKLYSDIFGILEQLVGFWELQKSQISTSILSKLEEFKILLVENSFFCHQAPPQVIFKGAKISGAADFLGGNSNLTKFFSPYEKMDVQWEIFNEEQAATFAGAGENHAVSEPSSRNPKNMRKNFANEIKNLRFCFKDFSLDSPKNCTGILDKKCRLIFYTKLSLNEEKTMKVWCLSAPFFIISSQGEERAAWGATFWDKYLRSPWNKTLFWMPEAPNETPWSIVSENLSKFFNDQTGTKKPLTVKNLNYLGRKLVKRGDLHPNSPIRSEMLFDPEGKSNLSFWDWFYSAVELTRKYLCAFWDSGEIVGFADVETTKKKFLKEESSGQFLICFSDVVPGAISVSVVHSQPKCKRFLRTFHPIGESQLKRRSLGQRIQTVSHVMSRAFSFGSGSDSDFDSEDEDFSKKRPRTFSKLEFDFEYSAESKIRRPLPEIS